MLVMAQGGIYTSRSVFQDNLCSLSFLFGAFVYPGDPGG